MPSSNPSWFGIKESSRLFNLFISCGSGHSKKWERSFSPLRTGPIMTIETALWKEATDIFHDAHSYRRGRNFSTDKKGEGVTAVTTKGPSRSIKSSTVVLQKMMSNVHQLEATPPLQLQSQLRQMQLRDKGLKQRG